MHIREQAIKLIKCKKKVPAEIIQAFPGRNLHTIRKTYNPLCSS